jgi:hypothetical protein
LVSSWFYFQFTVQGQPNDQLVGEIQSSWILNTSFRAIFPMWSHLLSPYKIGNHLMTDIYLFRHMFSLTSLGEGSEKRPTVTKHEMNGLRASFKKVLVQLYRKFVKWLEGQNFYSCWSNVRWGSINYLW